MTIRALRLSLLAATCLIAAPFAAHADVRGPHPHYLHALSDLRAARGLLEHTHGDRQVSNQEDVAIQEIDAAIGDLRQASIDDGKDVHSTPPAHDTPDHESRLRDANHLLRDAVNEANRGESEIYARHFREDALSHIRAAVSATSQAMHDKHNH